MQRMPVRRAYNTGSAHNTNNFAGAWVSPYEATNTGAEGQDYYNLPREEQVTRGYHNIGPVSNGNEYNGFLNYREYGNTDSYGHPIERDGGSYAGYEEPAYSGHVNKKKENIVPVYFSPKKEASINYGGWSNVKDVSRVSVVANKGGPSKSTYVKGGSAFTSGPTSYSSGAGGYSGGNSGAGSSYSASPVAIQKASATSYSAGIESNSYGWDEPPAQESGHKEHKGYTQATYISTKTDHSGGHGGHGHGGHEHGAEEHDDGHGHDHHVSNNNNNNKTTFIYNYY